MTSPLKKYFHIDVAQDNKSPDYLKIAIQNRPIKEVGENGAQVRDIIEFTARLIESFDEAVSCEENRQIIDHLAECTKLIDQRTADRQKRGVEGKILP